MRRLSIEWIDRLLKDGGQFASGAGKVSGRAEHRDELRRTSSGKRAALERAFGDETALQHVYSSGLLALMMAEGSVGVGDVTISLGGSSLSHSSSVFHEKGLTVVMKGLSGCDQVEAPSSSGVHGGGNDAPPSGRERRRHQEPLPEGQEKEEPVVGVSSPRPPGQQSLRVPRLSKAPSHDPLCSLLRSTSTSWPRSWAWAAGTCALPMRPPCWRS